MEATQYDDFAYTGGILHDLYDSGIDVSVSWLSKSTTAAKIELK
jgi:hypothetical protein